MTEGERIGGVVCVGTGGGFRSGPAAAMNGHTADQSSTHLRNALLASSPIRLVTTGPFVCGLYSTMRQAAEAALVIRDSSDDGPTGDGGRQILRIGLGGGPTDPDEREAPWLGASRAAERAAAWQVLVASDLEPELIDWLPHGAAIRWTEGADGLPSAPELTRATDVIPHFIPAAPTDFVGRVREMGELAALLDTRRLISLTGPPGSGKTRLAIEVARDNLGSFRDGVWFVSLGAISDPGLVLPTIAQAISIPLDDPADAGAFAARLSAKRMLLVLDNFEQVLDAAGQLESLLAGASHLRILVTTRAPLAIDGEQEYLVSPLPTGVADDRGSRPEESDAVRLFTVRAQAIRPDFALDANNSLIVADICRMLDGLPLAIELAAARIRILEPAALRDHLATRLIDLPNPIHTAATRHRSVRAAIESSYDRLDAAAKALLRRMSIFTGGCTEDALRSIADPERGQDLLTIAETLVAHSLVTVEASLSGARFGMLQTIREFAGEALEGSGERVALQRRHATYFAHLAEHLAPDLMTSSQRRALDGLELDQDNLRAALVWAIAEGETDLAHRLGASLWRFWQQRGQIAEGRGWLTRVLAMPAPASQGTRAAALSAAGGLAYWGSELDAARSFDKAAVSIWRTVGDGRQLGRALYDLGSLDAGRRPLDAPSTVMLKEAIELANAAGDALGSARATWALGVDAAVNNDLPRGNDLLARSIAAFHQLDAPFDLGWALHTRGLTALQVGDAAMAHDSFDRALTSFAAMGDVAGVLFVLDDVAQLAVFEGDLVRARRLAGGAAALRGRSASDLAALSDHRAEIGRMILGLDERLQPGDPEPVARAWAEGIALSVDEAIVAARAGVDVAPQSVIRVRVFALGPFRVEIDGAEIDDWGASKSGGRQAQALFAMLLSRRGRGITKDEALDVIWPDRELPQAEAAFHRTISGLRSLFRSSAPNVVTKASGRYVLDFQAVDWIDVDAFEDRLGAMGLGLLDGSAVFALEEARSLYRGDYLEDVPFYGEGPDVEDVRDRVRMAMVEVLVSLGRRYEARGERTKAGQRYRDAVKIAGGDHPAALEGLRRVGFLSR
jgi:predicted ATPase